MTLAQRLLLAIAVLTIVSTAAQGWGVREAWRSTERSRFEQQFRAAASQLELDLRQEVERLPRLLEPLCRHDPVVDSALLDLGSGQLDAGRRLALSQRVPELMRALQLDELVLLTGDGTILGAGRSELVGKRDPRLAGLLANPSGVATLRAQPGPRAVESHCSRTERGVSVGLYAARHLSPLLLDTAKGFGLHVSLDSPHGAADKLEATMNLSTLGGLAITASQSREPLFAALRRLDATVIALGGATFAGALLLAWLLSRGLARPIVDLAEQARVAVHGEPQPVEARGGRELKLFAESFNRAIADLAALRKRLAATERIAAQREVARRVAHEIKNPLAPIRAAMETLRRLRAREDPAFDEYFDEASQTVLSEVNRITAIVQEFTRFARLPPPRPEPIDLVEVVRQIVSLHGAAMPGLRTTAPESLEIVADKDQLIQVLTNLVQNAAQATSEREDPVVSITVTARAAQAEIVIADNGPGVPESMQPHLFEPYVTGRREGTGLGLSIVERIVVEHGGEIHYRDAPLGGAQFVVSLPLTGPVG